MPRRVQKTGNPFRDYLTKSELLKLQTQMRKTEEAGLEPTSLGYLKAMRDRVYEVEGDWKSPLQSKIAPAEHRAFSREFVEDDWRALPVMLSGAPPVYALGKKVAQSTGLDKYIPFFGGSEPSLAQVSAGYEGMWQGVRNRLSKLVSGRGK